MPVDTSAASFTSVLQGLQGLSESHKTVFGTRIPSSARPVFAPGSVIAPAFGALNQVIIVEYTVPAKMMAALCGLVLGYVGGGGSALPGQVLYSIDVDNPFAVPTPGIGYTEKDYALVPFQLGSFVPGDPWPVQFKHDEEETIRIKAQTVSGVATGPGNFVYGALMGFQGPARDWER